MLSMDMSSSGSNYDYDWSRHSMEQRLHAQPTGNTLQVPPIFVT